MGNFLFIVSTGLIIGLLFARFFTRRASHHAHTPSPEPAPYQPPVFQPLPPELHDDSSALDRKMRLEEERDFIFKLNEKLALAHDSAAVARTIVDEISAFLNVEICSLYVYDAAAGVLRAEAVCGIPQVNFLPVELKLGESVSGEVGRSRSPVLVNDFSTNPFFDSINVESCLKSPFMSVPLVFQTELIGVLNAASKKSGAQFKQDDLTFLQSVERVASLAFKNCRLVVQMQGDYLKTITTLALLIDARDSYTNRHSENVTRYAVKLARELKLPGEQVELISRAGLLHDIGKIGIRDSVLLKEGKLTDEEFEQIKTHPGRGADIVSTLPSMAQIASLVRHHHERFDGRGYPDRKKGEEIELGARILAIADSFDAMTTDRPYRKALTIEEAAKELERGRSTQFDPFFVDAFLRILKENPGLLSEGQVSSPARPARSIP